MDANDFIELSGKLVKSSKAGARSAVSRAYYGVFHLAKQLVEEVGNETVGGGQAHSLIPQFLQQSTHAGAVKAGRALADLHSCRVKADYDLKNEKFEKVMFAQKNLDSALEIRKLLNEFRDECVTNAELRMAFQTGIRQVNRIHGRR
jgi:uncharacterized protein (UPF0332 family)